MTFNPDLLPSVPHGALPPLYPKDPWCSCGTDTADCCPNTFLLFLVSEAQFLVGILPLGIKDPISQPFLQLDGANKLQSYMGSGREMIHWGRGPILLFFLASTSQK